MSDDRTRNVSPVKRALLEIRRLRKRLEQSEARHSEAIAVVGMGCRFPGGVDGPSSFWDLLCAGRDAIVEVPPARWDAHAYYDADPDAPGRISTRWGGFLEDIDRFDAEFFGISAREAATIDPQQRLLLEVAWEALEHAGIPPDKLADSATGVFTGVASFDYAHLELQTLPLEQIDPYIATGSSHSVAAGRISYTLGLKGPCLSVDTACSASLVAVHLACQSLRLGECRTALAGGVSVLLLPEMFIDFSKARMMAADGRCKAFDAAADGYVRSEGCGIVVLKRVSDAMADGDRVLAVIRGSATNQDGRSNGLTAPNGPSQAAVIRAALRQAGVEPAHVGYVEAHGTGTSLGDPIEIHALAEALGAGRPANRPLRVGSVKTNLGHLEAAAGVASLIKVILCLRNRALPASLHFRTPNPRIAWDRVPVRVMTRMEDWASDGPRIAGVSSFGFSGTNAHVIVEEAASPPPSATVADRPVHVVTVSARTDAAVSAACARLASALRRAPQAEPGDVAWLANAGRAHFARRAAVVGRTTEEVASALELLGGGAVPERAARSDGAHADESGGPHICFLFAGQGAQYAGMGAHLFESEPVFREALERCDRVLGPLLGRTITSVLYSDPGGTLLRRLRFAQPAVVTVEWALAELWRSWGVRPAAVAGHSLGEYAAAIVSGVLSLDEGLALVAERARLIEERCVPGGMVAVRAAADVVNAVLADHGRVVGIAAFNGTESVVVSGLAGDVDAVVRRLENLGIRTQPLETDRAFHHALLEPALDDLTAFARTLMHRPPVVPFLSTRDGAFFEAGAGPGAEYWADQARRPVRFHDAVLASFARDLRVYLELGPSATLTGMAREVGETAGSGRRWLSSLRKGHHDWESISASLAGLYVEGAPVDWRAVLRRPSGRSIDLPAYPFERRRHWFNEAGTAGVPASARGREPRTQPAGVESGAVDRAVWERAAAAARHQSTQAPLDLEPAKYASRWKLLEALTTAYVLRALRTLGLFEHAGGASSAGDIVREAALVPMYEGLVERWLSRLARQGHLNQHGAGYVATAPLPSPAIGPLEEEARAAFADSPFLVDYVARCGASLVEVITGRESALETLFPGGSRQTALDLYRHWAVSRYFNQIVAAAAAAVAAHSPAEPMQLLEVGAGTGGTTAAVLPVLPPGRVTYWFTDTSEFFFGPASEDFAAFPFVRFGTLDLERNPLEQGYGRHAFDAVIAANVLHATKDLEVTVDRVASLLSPGGALIVYEVTAPPAWLDTSVALISGWAEAADGRRDEGPLLSASSWRRLLWDRGFGDVAVFPEPGSPAEVFGMTVIVARAPATASERATPVAVVSEPAVRTHSRASEWLERLRDALPSERREALVRFVREHVCAVLRRDPGDEAVRGRRNLMELGMDSLMALELRDRLGSGLALATRPPATLIFDYPNIEAIAGYLAGALGLDLDDGQWSPDPGPADAKRHEIESLSDEAVAAMLLRKLEGKSTA